MNRQILLKTILVGTISTALCLPAEASGLLVADGGFGGELEIREHDVNVTINNGIAVTDVKQVFLNKEDRIVEALYTFPVPKGASVSNFSMIINGKEMIGEVVEAKRAKEIYESYKQTKRDPGLLEQVDFKTFEMRIFPIPARAEQHVRVTYCQELDIDHDWATYVYPLATTSRGAKEKTTGRFSVTVDVKSEIPIADTSSPSHGDDVFIARHGDGYLRASLETKEGDLSRDLVLAYRIERPQTGIDIITSRSQGEDGYFQLTLTAGTELEKLNQGMDYVFVLDVSGSMAHDGKLGMSRNSLAAFIQGLSDEDRFELIAFNNQPQPLFRQLISVNETAQEQAIQHLEKQRPRGGTDLRGALETAYRYRASDRTLNVVLLSDGMTEVREHKELLDIIRARPSGARVFCVGVGNEVNGPLLTQMAEEAGGLAALLSEGDDFQRQAQAFRRKLMRPAASQIKIAFHGIETYDIEPKQIPPLFHGSPVRVYGRYKTGGTASITVEGDALGAPFRQVADVQLPETENDNPEIERMWASYRIQQLMNEARRSGTDSNVKDEIVRLCEGYSVTSQYASFLVLENDSEYKRWQVARRNATRIERDRSAQVALRSQLEKLREQSLAEIGPIQQIPTKAPDKRPSSVPVNNSTPRQPAPTANPGQPQSDRSFNIPMPAPPTGGGGGGGGGAIDPVTGTVALLIAGAAYRRRRRTGIVTEENAA